MNKRETVQALMDSIQKGDFGTAGSMLAEDFQFSGPVSEPINAGIGEFDSTSECVINSPWV